MCDTSSRADSSNLVGQVRYQALRPAGLRDLRRDRLLMGRRSGWQFLPPLV